MSAPRILLLASDAELVPESRVWGTGGWQMPEEREGLDWLTFARLLGWEVEVVAASTTPPALGESFPRCVIVGCDPRSVSEMWVRSLDDMLRRAPVLVVARAAPEGSHFAELAGTYRAHGNGRSRELSWTGPGPRWSQTLRDEIDIHPLQSAGEVALWAHSDVGPAVVAKRHGKGNIATVSFHPSAARDVDGSAGAFLRHMLVNAPGTPVAWLDFERTLVLRMDDPGGAQNVHSKNWSYAKLRESEWRSIANDLERRNARISIGYTSGWVDDGDADRGDLRIKGAAVPRKPGLVYPSPHVRYEDRHGHSPGTVHDYESEFRGIQALRRAGRGDVELHGFTHMHPDAESWSAAADRYEATLWYRELGARAEQVIRERQPVEHPLALGVQYLKRFFDTAPTTLIAPGDEWTSSALGHALDLGILLADSYYLAIKHSDRFCWTTHVCSPYLSEPSPHWFNAGLPVVGYFHDYELHHEGVAWMTSWLDSWEREGCERFIDFRELAAACAHRLDLYYESGSLRLRVMNKDCVAPPRPVKIRLGGVETRPASLAVEQDGVESEVGIQWDVDGRASVEIPSATDHSNRMSIRSP